MAVIKIQGIAEWATIVEHFYTRSPEVLEKAVSAGAGVIADAVRQEVENLPIDEHFGTPENPLKGIKRIQKRGLEESLGITPIGKDRGLINRKIGFDGYNNEHTKTFPNGKPNQLIARSIESGTTFSRKNRFFKRAVGKSKEAALKKMEEVIEQELERIAGGR